MATSTLRDSLLPVADSLRALPVLLGVRRFSVTIRRRVWSGIQIGEGTATDYNIPIIPLPRVHDMTINAGGMMTPTEAETRFLGNQIIPGHYYKISGITPRYTTASGATGGYLAEQLRLWPNIDGGPVEFFVCLVGDDGYLRECAQIDFEQDRSFGYSMLVKEYDRPRTSLQSVAIAPSPLTIQHGTTQQLTCTGTFSGGATTILTALSIWTSTNPSVATVDIYGNLTAVSAGTATVTAEVLGTGNTLTVTVT